MQYLAWPDHGVPSDPQLFLQFTEKVRAARKTTLLQEIDHSLKQMRLLDDDDDEDRNNLAVNSDDSGESPEEIDLPPSTSIHQFISAANPPIVVHCSAGIGRTGVLILMDTALALMDAKEPVYPLDIVQAMRDQRACMVQNVVSSLIPIQLLQIYKSSFFVQGQYRFVCECICAAYAKIMQNESTAAALATDELATAVDS